MLFSFGVGEAEKESIFNLSPFEKQCDEKCNLLIKQTAICVTLNFHSKMQKAAICVTCRKLSGFENKDLHVLHGWYS